jgi:hypothetical protein
MQHPIGLHGLSLVPTQEFSSRMKQHWTSTLGLCSSGPLVPSVSHKAASDGLTKFVLSIREFSSSPLLSCHC